MSQARRGTEEDLPAYFYHNNCSLEPHWASFEAALWLRLLYLRKTFQCGHANQANLFQNDDDADDGDSNCADETNGDGLNSCCKLALFVPAELVVD